MSDVSPAAAFDAAMGRFVSGVTVVTTQSDGVDRGTTVAAMTPVSSSPPMLLVCLTSTSATMAAIAQRGRLAVNVLAEDHAAVAIQFASHVDDRFAGVEIVHSDEGMPLLVGAIARFEGDVESITPAGTHSIVLVRVESSEHLDPGHPLAYFRNRFGRLQTESDDAALRAVRDHLLTLSTDRRHIIDPTALSIELGTPIGVIHHVITALVSEGMLRREAGVAILEPLPDDVTFDYYRARLVLELGLALETVGRLDTAELARLRELMEATLDHLAGDRLVDPEAYVAANNAFHEYLFSLAGSRVLADTYRRLGLNGLERRTLDTSTVVRPEVLDDHRRLVEAYEAGDVDAAVTVFREHANRPREMRGLSTPV